MQDDAPKPRRPRFSLLWLLLFMATASVAAFLGVTLKKNVEANDRIVQLEAKVRRLRNDLGQLIVDDPEKLFLIEIQQLDPHTRKWRMRVPKSGPRSPTSFYLHAWVLDEEGLPEAKLAKPLPLGGSGEFVFVLQLLPDESEVYYGRQAYRVSSKWFDTEGELLGFVGEQGHNFNQFDRSQREVGPGDEVVLTHLSWLVEPEPGRSRRKGRVIRVWLSTTRDVVPG